MLLCQSRQKSKKTKNIKFRHMLLLEVLMAMALVALCILPIIAPQLAIVKEQKTFLRQMKLDHTAHLLYVHVLEELYNNKPDWQQIENSTPLPVPDDVLPENFDFDATYFFTVIKEKNDVLVKEQAFKAKEWFAYRLQITFAFAKKNTSKTANTSNQLTTFSYEVSILRHIPSNHDSSQDPLNNEDPQKPGKQSTSGSPLKTPNTRTFPQQVPIED